MAEGGGPACGGGQQPQPPATPQQQLHMNWSHFKPEFSGKPDEDVEAHLLRTNNWMTTHDFPEAVKVQRFCLTLVGEARNWYATLEPVAMMWPELQNMFRHQYSKIGNMREQLFHAWRSFHYDENVETPDAYVIRIKQVARLLGYEDLQVLEVFKNTVPNRLYWVLFSIDNLHDAVETAKRFLTKEKIDRQMTGQSSTPFMKLSDKKRKSVTFETKEALERTSENMERMTVLMDKMYIKLEQKDVPYKLQIYKRGRGQNRRQFNRGNNWRGYRSFNRSRSESNRGYGRSRGNFRRGTFQGRGNFRGRYNNNRMDRSWENRRLWRQSRYRERERRSRLPSSSRSGSRISTNRDRIRCFKCREYDHFANECPNQTVDSSDRDSDSARSASLHLADSDTGLDTDHYLNI